MARLLLAKEGVDPDSKNESGETALLWAVRYGHEAVVKLLLDSDKAQDGDSKDRLGGTALSHASENGHEAVVKLLLASDKVQDVEAEVKATTRVEQDPGCRGRRPNG